MHREAAADAGLVQRDDGLGTVLPEHRERRILHDASLGQRRYPQVGEGEGRPERYVDALAMRDRADRAVPDGDDAVQDRLDGPEDPVPDRLRHALDEMPAGDDAALHRVE